MAPVTDAGFTIEKNPKAVGGQTITCHTCGMTSSHPKDVEHRYCGNCNRFHEDKGSKRQSSA